MTLETTHDKHKDDHGPSFPYRSYRSWKELRSLISHSRTPSSPVLIDLLRHGESVTNARGLITGTYDSPLTPRGRSQAAEAASLLDKVYDAAFQSTLRRSQETLSIALAQGRITAHHVYTDDRLDERHLGNLELQPVRHIPQLGAGSLDWAPPGGDNYYDVSRRVLAFLLDLVEWIRIQDARKILISGHKGPSRVLMGILTGASDPQTVLSYHLDNARPVRLTLTQLTVPRFLNGAM